jgi:hypothetical protein
VFLQAGIAFPAGWLRERGILTARRATYVGAGERPLHAAEARQTPGKPPRAGVFPAGVAAAARPGPAPCAEAGAAEAAGGRVQAFARR